MPFTTTPQLERRLTQLEQSLDLCDFHTASFIAWDLYSSTTMTAVEKEEVISIIIPQNTDHAAPIADHHQQLEPTCLLNQVIFRIAESLYANKKYKECLKSLEPYGDLVAEHESLACLVANCWIHLGQLDEAADFIQTIVGPSARATFDDQTIPYHGNSQNENTLELRCDPVVVENCSMDYGLAATTIPIIPYLDFVIARTRIAVASDDEETLSYTSPIPSSSSPTASYSATSQSEQTDAFLLSSSPDVVGAIQILQHAVRNGRGSEVLVLSEQVYLSGRDPTLIVPQTAEMNGFSELFSFRPLSNKRMKNNRLQDSRKSNNASELERWLDHVLADNNMLSDATYYCAPLIFAARTRRMSPQAALYQIERYAQLRPYSLPMIYTALDLCLSDGTPDQIAMICSAYVEAELPMITSGSGTGLTQYNNSSEKPLYEALALWAVAVSALLDSHDNRATVLIAQQRLGGALEKCFNLFHAWIHFSKAYHVTHQLDQAVMACRTARRLAPLHDECHRQWERLTTSAGTNTISL